MRVARVAPLVLVALAGAGGCGDNVRPSTDGVRSGDRLKATFIAGDDARLFTGFHDQERGERCRFEMLPDQERAVCIASSPTAWATEFSDDRCMVPIVRAWLGPDGQPPRVARVDAQGCDPPVLWQLGEPVALSQYYSRTALGSCAWHPGVPGEQWHPAVAQIRIDELVGGRIHVEDRGGPLHVRYVDGDDGSRQPIGMYDDRISAPCRFTERIAFDTEVELGCYPDICAAATDGWFDERCLPIAARLDDPPGNLSKCECAERQFALVWPSGPTPGFPEIRLAGPELTPPFRVATLYDEDTCLFQYESSETRVSTRELFEPIVAAPAFVPGNGRLRPIVTTAGGATSIEPWFRDTELSLSCQPHLAADGVLRCLPSGLSELSDGFFVDDMCTQPARIAVDQAVDGPVRWAIVDEGPGWRTVYQLASEALPGNLFRGSPNTGCFAELWQRETLRIYIVGAEAALERFAPLFEIVE